MNVIEEARAYFNYTWPEQLTSGVMFFKGVRITKAQFLYSGEKF